MFFRACSSSNRTLVFSRLLSRYISSFSKKDAILKKNILLNKNVPVRNSSEGKMKVKHSEFNNEKVYDELHFFITLGIIPFATLTFFTNIFIGSAELVETPEDYEPKYWEYYSHPITRWISRYLMFSPQHVYENCLGHKKRIMESKKLVNEEKWFQESELEERDYRGWQFIPVNPAGVLRAHKEQKVNEEMGDWISR